jgi:predicted ribosomally synthesized peptide with SipW-like signal peptide
LRTARKLVSGAVVLALVAAVSGLGTWSVFSQTTSNSGNSFAAGTVAIGDNDAGAAMLSLSNARPGDSDTSCIVVTYTGSLSSSVQLFGTTTGTGLDPYLDLKVTRGTISLPTFDSCTGFTADSNDYIGAGAGVIYNGTLQGYPDSYASGIVDPLSGTPESWTNGEAHAYKLQVTVQDNDAAIGKNATQTFTWEARNE